MKGYFCGKKNFLTVQNRLWGLFYATMWLG